MVRLDRPGSPSLPAPAGGVALPVAIGSHRRSVLSVDEEIAELALSASSIRAECQDCPSWLIRAAGDGEPSRIIGEVRRHEAGEGHRVGVLLDPPGLWDEPMFSASSAAR